jgi:GNAT superfamily N-acetyltransferase
VDLPVVIRTFKESDRAFIVSSWVSTFKRFHVADKMHRWWLSHYAQALEPERPKPSVYFYLQSRYVNWCLDNLACIVACYHEDPDVIIGYVCADVDNHILKWVAVKPEYQRKGVGKALCQFATADNSKWAVDDIAKDAATKYYKMLGGIAA